MLDACVLIAHFDASDAHHHVATELLLRAADDQLGASPISLGEALVGPARKGNLEAAAAVVGQLGIETIQFPPDAPVRLAAIRAATSLKMPDSCVMLAVEQSGAALATFDKRLAMAAADRGFVVWGRD